MSEMGRNIVDGFRELREFCTQVSLLLRTADGFMQKHDWTPIRPNVLGNLSRRVDYPDGWLPTDFSRFYEHSRSPNLLLYIAVLVEYLDEPSRIEQALLSAGWVDYGVGNDVEDWEYHFCNWHLVMPDRDDSGKLCSEDPRQTWKDDPPPAGVVKVTTFAYPLDHFTCSETLNMKIVQPLLAAISQEPATRPSRGSRNR